VFLCTGSPHHLFVSEMSGEAALITVRVRRPQRSNEEPPLPDVVLTLSPATTLGALRELLQAETGLEPKCVVVAVVSA